MAIDTQSMLLKLSPMSAIDIGPARGEKGLERERLALMREQFENQKKQQDRDAELRQLEENGRLARERMTAEREQQKAAAAAQAEQQKQKQAAYQKFTELNGQGKIQEARAMVPLMSSLGMGVDLQGEENGLPRYRVSMDAAADEQAEAERLAQASPYVDDGAAPDNPSATEETAEQSLGRLGAMGYPTDDTGAMQEPAGIPSTQDAYQQALNVTQIPMMLGQTPTPTRGPDAEDFSGGVPSDVIDTGAMQAQTLARLNPAIQGFAESYPEALRPSVEATGRGVSAMGLPATESVEMLKSLRGGPDSFYAAEATAKAQAEKRDEPDYMQRFAMEKEGYDRGEKAADQYKVKDAINNREQYKIAKARLTNKDTTDDELVAALISRRMGERGATTEPDVARVLGTNAMSFFDQLRTWGARKAMGGLSNIQKNALTKVLQEWEDADRDRVLEYVGQIETQIAAPGTIPQVAKGLRDHLRTVVPKTYRDEWAAKARKGSDEGAVASADGARPSGEAVEDEEFIDELYIQAEENDLDPEKILPLIRHESGGKAGAVNKKSGATGLIQFLNDDVAKSVGTTIADLKEMNAAEQLPYVFKYLKDRGVTREHDQGDIYVAIAAPAALDSSNETVVYEKGTKEYDQNVTWDVDGDGVITRGDLYRWGLGERKGGKGKSAKAEPAATDAAPKATAQADTNAPVPVESAAAFKPKNKKEQALHDLLYGGG